MAEVPAVKESPEETITPQTTPEAMGVVNRLDESKMLYAQNDVAKGFMKLSWLRQIGLLLGVAGVITFAFLMVIWSQATEYKPLYNNLESNQSSAVVNVLSQAGISFTVEPETGMVLVAVGELHEARMQVAAANIIAPTGMGYDLLDREQALGTSQFMETARYRRAIEGELARTISSLKNVRKSRVLLAIPKQSVFVRDNRKPSASVFIEVTNGREIEKQQVKAIMHLVAFSVPEMKKQDVSVVDQHGNLLSEIEDDAGVGESEKQLQFAKKVEEEILSKINNILRPILGDTKFRAQVAADIDFTWVEETQEMFNPDLPAIRSEETLEEQRGGSAQGGIPGALSNQPPGQVSIPETTDNQAAGEEASGNFGNRRSQATRNYELDRTISHTRYQTGRVTRLTIAVVLDDIRNLNAVSGEEDIKQWDDASLARLSQLVRDAVGFSTIRGDRVTVINESFQALKLIELVEPGFWTEAWFIGLTKQLLVGLLIVFLTFFVLKPVLNMLAGPTAEDRMKELMAEQELEKLAEEELEQEGDDMQETVTLSGGEELLLPGPGDQFSRQIDTIKLLVDENPSRVAQVVKEWISVDQ